MTASSRNSALLVLADGTVLEGEAFGHRGDAMGEVVFRTFGFYVLLSCIGAPGESHGAVYKVCRSNLVNT